MIWQHAYSHKQAEQSEALFRGLLRLSGGRTRVDATVLQLADAQGRTTAGMSSKDAHQRYRKAIRGQVGFLCRLGLVESWEPLYDANGEGRCIVITLPAGVAQSVRAAES